MPTHFPLDWQALDRLVVSIPVHVLYFDGGLICRYAAPDGPHFLGQPATALLGSPAERIFPVEVSLAPRLEQVLTTQQPWRSEQVAYPAGPQGGWPAGNWQVHVRPWTLAGASPAADAPQDGHRDAGVLMSCLPCPTATPAATAAMTPELLREGEHAAVLLEGIRTQLTVIRGFASLLRRREQLHDVAGRALGRIELAAVTLTDLVQQYEAATRLSMHHPNLPVPGSQQSTFQ